MQTQITQLTKELVAKQRRTFKLIADFDRNIEKWIAHAKAGYPVEKS